MQARQTQQVPQTILVQLKAGRVHGFPFFAYTGIKSFDWTGDNTLSVLKIPGNPDGITKINVFYDYDRDTHTVSFFENHQTETCKEFHGIHFDQPAKVIAKEMGVY